MSQHADDRRLGEHLVTTGKLTSEELAGCFEAQQQLGGPGRKRLGDVLVEQGLVTPLELQGTMALSSPPAPQATDGPTPLPTSIANAEPLPADVRHAMADTSRRIGRYVILNELGRGGMGVVYRGYDPQLRRDVAIKMIVSERVGKSDERARFLREAQACARLRHPSIVAVHEIGELAGQPYLVMDLVKGSSLSHVIGDNSFSLRQVTTITRDVALALHHAHCAGVIHRDVKPDNVMLDEDGHPLLMDFGLAQDTTAKQRLTQTGQAMGTPLYMTPEQIESGSVGPWTDVYALGAVLYHVLTGRPPLEASNPVALFRKIMSVEPTPPRAHDAAIHRDLETIALKCLEKEPSRRYISAAALADDLQRFLDGEAILARPMGRGEKAARWVQRNLALSAAVAAMVIVAAGATATLIHQAVRARREKEQIRQTTEREAVRREERARLKAEMSAREHEETAIADATRQQRERLAERAQEKLRNEVAAVLDEVRSGEVLADQNDREIAKAKLLKHRELETVRLLTSELDALSRRLDSNHELSHGQEAFLHFLCEALWNLGSREGAVVALGRYLETELSLPKRPGQLRAVPAGKALCLLGGEEADRLMLEARDGFGINGPFWRQVLPFYSRIGVEVVLQEKTAEGYQERGLVLLTKGDLDGAIADFTRAIEMEPNNTDAWNCRGLAKLKKGDLDGSMDDHSRCVEIAPNVAKFWSNRGNARLARGDLQGAFSDYFRAIELDPSHANAWNGRGAVREHGGDLEGAIDDYTRAIELAPMLSVAWRNRGSVRLDTGDIKGALEDESRAIEINSNDSAAWNLLGTVHLTRGELDIAIDHYTRAIEINRDEALPWYNRGRARTALEDLGGAIADYSRCIEIAPDFASAWQNRGVLRTRNGDLPDAIADFSRVISINPRHGGAWYNRGIARAASGDLQGAIEDYSRSIEIDPEAIGAWSNRGTVRAANGDPAGAIADFTRAIEIDPQYVLSWCNRGRARSVQNNLNGAIADFERFLQLAPNHPQAPAVREWLRNARRGR